MHVTVLAIGSLSALAGGLAIVLRKPAGAFKTVAEETDRMPSGIPYIVGNEGAERFAFYGMKGVLIVFMTRYLLSEDGSPAPMRHEDAMAAYHLFAAAAFVTPLAGAILADWLFGKYRLILGLSLVYCAGNLALAYDQTQSGLAVGLSLIALASGGIKPLCTANVADQFGTANRHLFPIAMKWFYAAINAGALATVIIMPWLLERAGAKVAFTVPAVLMLLATAVFWLGRHRFVHAPPAGNGVIAALREEGPILARRLLPVLSLAVIFFALFEQQGSAFILQAQEMDRNILGFEVLAAQMQAVNPLFILVMIPLLGVIVLPTVARFVKVTDLGKCCAGCVLMVLCYVLLAYVQTLIDHGERPHIAYHLLAYVLVTAAEVLLLVTLMEYTCQQATRLRSMAMSFFLLAMSAGNLLTSAVNYWIALTGGLEGANYFLFFSALMAATGVGFGVMAWLQRRTEFIALAERRVD
jgi:POT family proton-dependent oligopeptide transporter